ncbi:MAG: PQQ-binding-like beta-propeller repeat protein, partial [Acidimicrobiales bacterium]
MATPAGASAGHSRGVPRPAVARVGQAGASTTRCPTSALQAKTQFGVPKWCIYGIGPQGFTSPVAGSIDGVPVVVDASLSGWVYVVNARTGAELPGWPQPVTLVGTTRTAVDSSPAIAYLDGPNRPPSIVVGAGSLYVKDQNGGVMAWSAAGKVRFRFLTKKTFPQFGGANDWTNSVFATPAIGDITGSGQQDVVFGSYDHFIYALSPSGRLLPGFPINRADTIWSSPALVDVTHSGKDDIIEGGDSSGWKGPTGGPACFHGWVSDYRYQGGGPKLVWERCMGETIWSSPAVTTFGTTPVVVVGTSYFPTVPTSSAENEIFAFNATNGRAMPGWPVNAGGPTFGSPAVGPLTTGGANAVVATSCARCASGPAIVTAWTQSGHRLWQQRNMTPRQPIYSSPVIANLDGTSTNDVLVGNTGGLFVLDGKTGYRIDLSPLDNSCNMQGSPAVLPIGGGKSEFVTNCGWQGSMASTLHTYLRAYIVHTPYAGSSNPYPWPMFRANAQRTGVPDPNGATHAACHAPSPLPTGYLLAGAAGSVLNFGRLGWCGSLSRQLVPGALAGIASTPDGGGYWLALRDGAVYSFGDAKWFGDTRTSGPAPPIVGISTTADGKGYFLLAGDGSVLTFGDAKNYGNARGKPVVAIATDYQTGGYWIATSTGQVYGEDAVVPPGNVPNARVVGIASARTVPGYWLALSNGGVEQYGVGWFGSKASPH